MGNQYLCVDKQPQSSVPASRGLAAAILLDNHLLDVSGGSDTCVFTLSATWQTARPEEVPRYRLLGEVTMAVWIAHTTFTNVRFTVGYET